MKKFLSRFWFAFKNFWTEPGNRIIAFFIFSVILFAFVILQAEIYSKRDDIQIKSIFDAVYWLFITITTVGYGDYVPKSDLGKIIAILTVISGVFLFSFFSGSIASYLIDIRIKERRGLGTVNVVGHIMILGWNQNLEKVISGIPVYLGDTNFNLVLVNDGTEEDYDEIKSKFLGYKIKFIHGDFTKENVLKRANIDDASKVIILSDVMGIKTLDEADERTLLAVLTIKSIEPEIPIFAEVIKEEKSKHIARAGADTVILNGEFNPMLISSGLASSAMPNFIKMLLANTDEPRIRLEPVPKLYIGKKYHELLLFLRDKTKGIPVALVTAKKDLTIDDLLSSDSAIDSFIRQKFKEAEENFSEDDGTGKKNIKINPDDEYIIDENDTQVFIIY